MQFQALCSFKQDCLYVNWIQMSGSRLGKDTDQETLLKKDCAITALLCCKYIIVRNTTCIWTFKTLNIHVERWIWVQRHGGGSRKLYIVMRGDHFNKITFKRGDRLNFIVFSPKSLKQPQQLNHIHNWKDVFAIM